MSSSLTKSQNKSTSTKACVSKQYKALLIYDLLVFSSYEPDPFTSAQFYPSLLLPAFHRLGFIVTMGQLTPHATLVLGFPLDWVIPFCTYLPE